MRGLWVLAVVAGCGRIGFAHLPDGAAGDGSGDGSVDGTVAPGSCNAIDRFFDDFEDGVQDPNWSTSYSDPGTSYSESGGDLVLTLAPNMASTYVGYSTGRFYDLREHRLFAEVAQTASTGADMGLAAQYHFAEYLHVYVRDGTVGGAYNDGTTFTDLGSMPFDPVANRFIAIAEHAGQVMFETSPDGVTFTTFVSTADPFDVSLLQTQLFAGTNLAVASPGVAKFASFNAPVAHAGGCPVSTLVDRFDDGVEGHDWEASYAMACCTLTETGGALQIATTGMPGFAARMSSAGYDLREGHLTVALPSGPATANMLASLRVDLDNNNVVELQVHATTIGGSTVIAGTTSNLPTVARQLGQNYFQLRESAGTLYLETSTDRVTWTVTNMLAAPFALDDVRVVLQGGIPGITTRPADSVTYANLGGP